MPKKRSWTDQQLIEAVAESKSIRMVLIRLGLVPAGGNYVQVNAAIKHLSLDISHFTGQGWNVGLKFIPREGAPLEQLLILNGTMQSSSLKKRLFKAGIKKPACELCGWCQVSDDGRIPVELDHINGDRHDKRIENLGKLYQN